MDAKRALLIAVGLAVGLPYLTVLLLEEATYGVVVVGALFVGVYLLIIVSDLRNDEADEAAEAAGTDGDIES